ncbi:MAG: rhomboid family intramembrane serine protease [bacterium]
MTRGMLSGHIIYPSKTKWVVRLAIVNILAFIISWFSPGIFSSFGLVPGLVIKGRLWQLVTYLFIHASFMHLFFNMIVLWFLGTELERYWGSNYFIRFYLVTGIGAGLVNVLIQPRSLIPIVGASGAIFGLIMGFALAFPDREIWLYFVIRIKAKHLAALLGFIEVIMILAMPGGKVARFAHLGGLLVGYLYLKQETLLMPIRWRLRNWRADLKRRSIQRETAKKKQISDQIDLLLDRIARDGLESLTKDERQFLERQGKKN